MNKIDLCDLTKCTQCLSCVMKCPRQCIAMETSEAGFSVPSINRQECIECGVCMQVCHQITPVIENKKNPSAVYAAWNLDDKIRCLSSSGGVFSAFAEKIIKKGGIVFGAAYIEGLKVKHIGVDTIEGLQQLRGSKYIKSNIGDCYKEVKSNLQKKRLVLFTGSPCQVAGLFSFLKTRYDNLYTCDFVCHGVPSQKAFDIYREKIGLSQSCIKKIGFRDTERWGFKMSLDGVSIPLINTYYLKAFTKGYMFMESCYSCQYATEYRISDITMADFWGLGDRIPFNHSKYKGVSLLLINSEKGERLTFECADSLFLEERTLDEAIQGNYNLSHASLRPIERNTYYEDSIRMSKFRLIRKYRLFPSWRDYLRPLKRCLQNLCQK